MDPTPSRTAAQPEAVATRPIDVGIWTWDPTTGEIVWSSELNEFYGGAPVDTALTPSWYTGFVHPDDAATVASALEQVLSAGGDASVEYRARRRDGDLRNMVVRAQRDAYSGRVTGVVIDLTDQHRSTAAAVRVGASGGQTNDDLLALNAQKDVFLRTVSHDLRSPLMVIERFAAMLRDLGDQLSADERHAYAHRIVEASTRMRRQLADLLDLDRLSRGAVEAVRQPTDLLELALDAVHALDLGERATVGGDRLVAAVDAGQVERILENLLSNAARHAGPGGRIDVHVTRHDGGVLLTVDDDGPGVPAAMRDSVFDVFETGTAASAGTGVGLAVVRQFAELHGGRVWIEDTPGGGASLNVMLVADLL